MTLMAAGRLAAPIVQVAYFVPAVDAAVTQMNALYGAGPFFVASRIELAWAEHRGEANDFLHTSAYGQWGDMMLEIVQQDREGPSPFRDLFAPGESGLHHVAALIDSLPETYRRCAELGYDVASRAETLGGTEFAFIDTVADFGHMLEVYERTPTLLAFYAAIRAAAVGWNGERPLRPVSELVLLETAG